LLGYSHLLWRADCTLRTDNHGGGIENRIRLLGEVTRPVVDAIGADRTSIPLFVE
jgi:N-ethylmaleimide reductase